MLTDKTADDYTTEGNISAELGRYEEALRSYDQSLKLNPGNHEVLKRRCSVLNKMDSSQEALDSYNQLLEINPNEPDILTYRGFLFYKLQLYESAIESFDISLRIRPDDTDTLIYRGVSFWMLGQYEKALESFSQSLKIRPDDANTLNNCGSIFYKMKRYEDAIECYAKSLKIQPDDPDRITDLGSALNEIGRYEEALDCYDKSLSLRPDDRDTLNYRGNALRGLERYEDALESHNQALKIEPMHIDTLNYIGNVLYDLKRYDEALENYNQCLEIQPDNPDVLTCRGLTLYDLKRYEEALQSYNMSLKLRPDNADALNKRGNALSKLENYSEALESYNKSLKLQPEDAVGLGVRGNALYMMGRYEEALENFNQSLKLQPDNRDMLISRGNTLYMLARHEEAITDYTEAICVAPEHLMVYKNRAMALEALGRYQEASLDYKRSIQNVRRTSATDLHPLGHSSSGDFGNLKDELEETRRRGRSLGRQAMFAQKETDNYDFDYPERQLQELQENLQTLLNLKNDTEQARQAFQHPNLKLCYRQVNMKLEEIFIGCKTVASGFVSHRKRGSLSSIGEGIGLLGTIVSIVPVVGNALSGVLSISVSALSALDYQRQTSSIMKIANLGTVTELLKISETTARRLTECYEEQLLLLRTPEEETAWEEKNKTTSLLSRVRNFIEKVGDSPTEKAHSLAQDVAEYGVLKMLEAIQYERVDADRTDLPIEDQFLEVVMAPPREGDKDKLSHKLGGHTFTNRYEQKWSLYGIFQYPVIETPEGLYYGHAQSDVKTYGCRRVNAEMAQRWGMTKLDSPERKKGPSSERKYPLIRRPSFTSHVSPLFNRRILNSVANSLRSSVEMQIPTLSTIQTENMNEFYRGRKAALSEPILPVMTSTFYPIDKTTRVPSPTSFSSRKDTGNLEMEDVASFYRSDTSSTFDEKEMEYVEKNSAGLKKIDASALEIENQELSKQVAVLQSRFERLQKQLHQLANQEERGHARCLCC